MRRDKAPYCVELILVQCLFQELSNSELLQNSNDKKIINMKKYFIKITLFGSLALLLLSGTSCKKNYTNPAAVPEAQAFSSPQAMTGVAIGLQRIYTAGRASNLYNRVTINGLLTSELTVLNQGNTGEYQLQLGGGSVD